MKTKFFLLTIIVTTLVNTGLQGMDAGTSHPTAADTSRQIHLLDLPNETLQHIMLICTVPTAKPTSSAYLGILNAYEHAKASKNLSLTCKTLRALWKDQQTQNCIANGFADFLRKTIVVFPIWFLPIDYTQFNQGKSDFKIAWSSNSMQWDPSNPIEPYVNKYLLSGAAKEGIYPAVIGFVRCGTPVDFEKLCKDLKAFATKYPTVFKFLENEKAMQQFRNEFAQYDF